VEDFFDFGKHFWGGCVEAVVLFTGIRTCRGVGPAEFSDVDAVAVVVVVIVVVVVVVVVTVVFVVSGLVVVLECLSAKTRKLSEL